MAKLMRPANTDNNNDTLSNFKPIPPGEYTCVITKSAYKENKKKNGHYLELALKIVDGDFKGRLLFERLNLDNPHPVAVEIANKALNSICKACDKVGVEDSEELHGVPFLAIVKVEPETDIQPASNRIIGYSPLSESFEYAVDALPLEGSSKPSAKVTLPWE